MSSEGGTIYREVSPPIVKGTVLPRPRSFRVQREWYAQALDPGLVFDGIEDMFDRYLERNEVEFCCTSLIEFERTPRWHVDGGGVVARILPWGELQLWFLDIGSLFGRATGGSPCRLFNLHVILCSDKDVPHLGDIILHQVPVK